MQTQTQTEAVKESREIPWCCSACEDAGHILAGHFACVRSEIPAGWAITTDCGYGDGGWRAVIEPKGPTIDELVAAYEEAARCTLTDKASQARLRRAEDALRAGSVREKATPSNYEAAWLCAYDARAAVRTAQERFEAAKASLESAKEAASEAATVAIEKRHGAQFKEIYFSAHDFCRERRFAQWSSRN